MRSSPIILLAWALAAAVPAGALAQRAAPAGNPPSPGPPASPQPLKRVQQGVADVGPLGVSPRVLQQDLRVPTGFRDVFEIDPSNGADPSSRRFVRRNGAIFALFPRSIYRYTDRGIAVPVPPGTIFYIGGLPSHLSGEPVASAAAQPRWPTTLVRAGGRAHSAAGALQSDPAPARRAQPARPDRPHDPSRAGTEAPSSSPASASPRLWESRSSLPGLMDSEDRRRSAVAAVLDRLIASPAKTERDGDRPAPPPRSATPASPAPGSTKVGPSKPGRASKPQPAKPVQDQ
ncbi:MAG: hypothetical protein AB7G11_08255 [Phycisphaerales bacterium]